MLIEETQKDSRCTSYKEKHPIFVEDSRILNYIFVASLSNPEVTKLAPEDIAELNLKKVLFVQPTEMESKMNLF